MTMGLSKVHGILIILLVLVVAQLAFVQRHSFKVYVTRFRESDEIRLVRSNDEHYYVNHSMIHDQTLNWDPKASRLWLNPALSLSKRPQAMLLLTSYGWNQEDQETALQQFSRRIRETELMHGVINHRWFHPTAWEEYELHNASYIGHLIEETSTRFYVFLDFNTLEESHYPIYAGYDQNLDTQGGRVNTDSGGVSMTWIAHEKVWSSRWLTNVPHHRIKVVVLDGGGWGVYPGNRNRDFSLTHGLSTWNLPLAMVAISSLLTNANQSIDQGLIPPVIRKTQLTTKQVQEIDTCQAEHRPFLLTYTGNLRSGGSPRFHGRGKFHSLDDDKRVLIRRNFLPEYNESILANLTYAEVLSNSVFSLAARGDNKYSYKFSEVLAAGAIPVVLADDWMWPFRPELVDWNECAVIMPEKDAGEATLAVLHSLSVEQRCRMRKRCYEIFKKYVEHPEGSLDGIVQGLELVAEGQRKPMVGVKCKLGQGIWEEGWYRENVTEPDVQDCNLQ